MSTCGISSPTGRRGRRKASLLLFIEKKIFTVKNPKRWLTNYMLQHLDARRELMLFSHKTNVPNFVKLFLEYYNLL